jgi:hypothetical protein
MIAKSTLLVEFIILIFVFYKRFVTKKIKKIIPVFPAALSSFFPRIGTKFFKNGGTFTPVLTIIALWHIAAYVTEESHNY